MKKTWFAFVAWLVVTAAVGLALAPPGTSPVGKYALSWYAIGFVALAVVARRQRWARRTIIVLAAAAGVYLALRYGFIGGAWRSPAAWAYVVAGGVALVLSAHQAIRRSDPVAFAALILGTGAVAYWSYEALTGSGLDPSTYAPHTLWSPFRAELPLVALALAAVGLGISRGPRSAADRLGVSRPSRGQVVLALVCAMALLGVQPVFNVLTYWLEPGAFDAIGAVRDQTEGTQSMVVAIVFAVLAGIGEETLFRGAIQPRSGLVIAAALFAMMHTQYGVTPILAMMFFYGIALGVLRNREGTTTAIMAHGFMGVLIALTPVFSAYRFVFYLMLAILAILLWRWWVHSPSDAEATGVTSPAD